MTGLINGLNNYSPSSIVPDGLIQPLQLSLWRQGNQTSPFYNKAMAAGARYEFLTSDGWGYKGPSLPGDGGSWTAYDNYIQSQATLAVSSAHTMVWEFWNEPDLAFSKPGNLWPGSQPQFFEAYRHFVTNIRSQIPDALLAGPTPSNYNPVFLKQFMDYCLANSLELNVITWHEFSPDVREIPAHIDYIRTNFVNNPVYAALKLREIHINEFLGGGDDQYRPAALLSYLYNFEAPKANPDAVCKSSWTSYENQNNSFNGTLGGMLTTSIPQQPRALWWAYKAYADGMASRVASTATDMHLLPLASSAGAAPNTAQVLVGYYAVLDSAPSLNPVVNMENLGSLGFLGGVGAVHVNISRIPNTLEAALPAPLAVSDADLPISNGAVSVTLPGVLLHEAWLVTLSPATASATVIPPAPVNLAASAADGQVALSWNPVPGATSYNIHRAMAPGLPVATACSNIVATSFTDSEPDGRTNLFLYSLRGIGGRGRPSFRHDKRHPTAARGKRRTRLPGKLRRRGRTPFHLGRFLRDRRFPDPPDEHPHKHHPGDKPRSNSRLPFAKKRDHGIRLPESRPRWHLQCAPAFRRDKVRRSRLSRVRRRDQQPHCAGEL